MSNAHASCMYMHAWYPPHIRVSRLLGMISGVLPATTTAAGLTNIASPSVRLRERPPDRQAGPMYTPLSSRSPAPQLGSRSNPLQLNRRSESGFLPAKHSDTAGAQRLAPRSEDIQRLTELLEDDNTTLPLASNTSHHAEGCVAVPLQHQLSCGERMGSLASETWWG